MKKPTVLLVRVLTKTKLMLKRNRPESGFASGGLSSSAMAVA